ncbi:WD40-repeat-containing domain protein [Mycena olivaceomarginata]|nr:WD40-repeat-containing domain protein [Mycena olivaceomarginata]
MSFFLRRPSKHNNYILQSKLRGHSGGIVRLRATEDGRLLASGGTDGTKVWDLSTMRELRSPKSSDIRGASTALVWIKREDDLGKALFYGTQNGQLVCWKEGKQQGLAVFEEISCVRIVNPAEITGLAFDAPSNRLAVCHRGGMIQVFTLDSTMSLKEVFSLELKNVTPRAIAFGQMYFNDRDVMVFDLYRGDVYTLRSNNGNVVGQPWNVGGLIGDIALDVRKGVLITDEPSSGTNLYRLEDHTRVKTFPVAVTKQKRLRQVAFLEECQFIVSGSDHGIVYVFDRRSGDIVDELRVDPREWVQTIADQTTFLFGAKKSKRRIGSVGIACGVLIFLQLFFVAAAVLAAIGYQKTAKVPISVAEGLPMYSMSKRVRLSVFRVFFDERATAPQTPGCRRTMSCITGLSRGFDAMTAITVVAEVLVAVGYQKSVFCEDGAVARCRKYTLYQQPIVINGVAKFRNPYSWKLSDVEFRDAQAVTAQDSEALINPFTGLAVTDDGPVDAAEDLDTLANVFVGLVFTDDGPDVRRQQHSKLFSSRDDFQGSLSDVPLAFQPIPDSEAISSIQSLVNAALMRTAPPTRKQRRESTLNDILGRIRTAQQSLDVVYELYATSSDHDSASS